jgi:predicted nucleic acid-binding protein
MRMVFADTWYLLALVNPADQGHQNAVTYTKSFAGKIVTTAFVLVEFADALAGSAQGRAEFVATLEDLRSDPLVKIISGDDALLDEAIQLYARRLDKQWSLTDCISFVVMRHENISEALTRDRHFEQAGFLAVFQ